MMSKTRNKYVNNIISRLKTMHASMSSMDRTSSICRCIVRILRQNDHNLKIRNVSITIYKNWWKSGSSGSWRQYTAEALSSSWSDNALWKRTLRVHVDQSTIHSEWAFTEIGCYKRYFKSVETSVREPAIKYLKLSMSSTFLTYNQLNVSSTKLQTLPGS